MLEQVAIEVCLPKATFDRMDPTWAPSPTTAIAIAGPPVSTHPLPGCLATMPGLYPCHHRHRLAATTTATIQPSLPRHRLHCSRPWMPPLDRHRSRPHLLPNSALPPMPPLGRPQPPPPYQLRPPPSLASAMPPPSRGYRCHRLPSVIAPPLSSRHSHHPRAPTTHYPIHSTHCLGCLGGHPATPATTLVTTLATAWHWQHIFYFYLLLPPNLSRLSGG